MAAETELAWAAGFFDGEGCTRLNVRLRRPTSKTKQRVLVVSISQNDREVLDRFAKAVGVGVVRGPYSVSETARSYRPGRKPYFQYAASGAKGSAALDAIWPWLGSRKREQALAAGHVVTLIA